MSYGRISVSSEATESFNVAGDALEMHLLRDVRIPTILGEDAFEKYYASHLQVANLL